MPPAPPSLACHASRQHMAATENAQCRLQAHHMTAATAAAPAAAFAPGGSKQAADSGAAVEAAISAMAAAVQRGDFAGAEAAGAAAPANLALPRSCLSGLRPISEGAQAGVYAAQLAPARLVASLEGGSGELDAEELEGSLAVAVKKPRIRETAGASAGWVVAHGTAAATGPCSPQLGSACLAAHGSLQQFLCQPLLSLASFSCRPGALPPRGGPAGAAAPPAHCAPAGRAPAAARWANGYWVSGAAGMVTEGSCEQPVAKERSSLVCCTLMQHVLMPHQPLLCRPTQSSLQPCFLPLHLQTTWLCWPWSTPMPPPSCTALAGAPPGPKCCAWAPSWPWL